MDQSNTATQWPQLLTLQQAAEYLNTSLRHVTRLNNERKIPVVKVGRKVRINRTALDAWITTNTRPAVGA